jgi:nitrogen fixation NifU-like protein
MEESFDEFAQDLQEVIIRDARAYYTDKVVDLWLNPQNMGPLEHPDAFAKIQGPCGDTMEIFLQITADRVARATFTTDGCGPSVAAGSMATHLATGKTISQAAKLTGDDVLKGLGGLPEESQHCAILAARTLAEALQRYLSTEAARGGDTATGQRSSLNTASLAEDPLGR